MSENLAVVLQYSTALFICTQQFHKFCTNQNSLFYSMLALWLSEIQGFCN